MTTSVLLQGTQPNVDFPRSVAFGSRCTKVRGIWLIRRSTPRPRRPALLGEGRSEGRRRGWWERERWWRKSWRGEATDTEDTAVVTNGNNNTVVSRHYAWDQVKLVSQVQPGAAAAAASMRRAPTVREPVPVASSAYERPIFLFLGFPAIPSSNAQKRHRRETQRSRETRARGRRWRRQHPMSPAHHLSHAVLLRRRCILPSARLSALPYAEATMYYFIDRVGRTRCRRRVYHLIMTTTTPS